MHGAQSTTDVQLSQSRIHAIPQGSLAGPRMLRAIEKQPKKGRAADAARSQAILAAPHTVTGGYPVYYLPLSVELWGNNRSTNEQ